jgi:hypothetical protein
LTATDPRVVEKARTIERNTAGGTVRVVTIDDVITIIVLLIIAGALRALQRVPRYCRADLYTVNAL